MSFTGKIETIHRTAMNLAEQADRAPDAEKPALYRRAFEHERRAAEQLKRYTEYEPSRSFLYRSAASLAAQAGNQPECERLAKEGLAGNPPSDIAAELRELLPSPSSPFAAPVTGTCTTCSVPRKDFVD